ncbi:hypothetical protein MNBD_CHLOROFLEXI01-3943 [hydrothermal vent metagenome]|uniref:Baseplate protein J-like barrel domain-containing protein n=1 Tax=hydrothermal vent metagenome TaxID=652676 RepID=A0A3B0UGV4_9ZZZZ
MNEKSVTLIERPYQEIIDDILIAIVGGVVNEPIIFDIKSDLYALAEPAQDIRGITGTAKGEHHTFLKEIDFLFNPNGNAVEWDSNGTLPDDNSTFRVDYFRENGRSPLSDINVGSVTRTLSEAIGREITTVYEQINLAYKSGFIDTAEKRSLELVVSILKITRKTKDFTIGLATFFREAGSIGNITIPEGTLLSTAKGEVTFETTQPRTLQQGQARIDAPIRATEAFKGKAGKADAGAINQLFQPIVGISRVTNFDDMFLGAEDETDEELRLRAKAALQALGKATLAALRRVIFEGRGTLTEVWDPNSPADHRSELGSVTLLVEAEPERFPSLNAAVQETRAAGVQATLVSRYIYFKPRIFATIGSGLTAAGKLQVGDEVKAALQSYVDGLSSGDPAEGAALLEAIEGVDDVSKAQIVDVVVWRSDLSRPGAETLVDTIVTAVQGVGADDKALREAIASAVSETPPLVPTSTRIPDRSLLQGAAGQQATDEEIEAGEFQVVAQIGGEAWWVVLDVEAADIVLQEQES